MRKFVWFAAVLFTAGSTFGADSPCVAKKIKGWTYDEANLETAHYTEFFNNHNRHILSFIKWRANDKRGPRLETRLAIPGAYGNFADPIPNFFSMKVNGIEEKNITLNESAIQVWNDAKTGRSGVDVPLNFDGTEFMLRWYMRPDSGVLFLNLVYNPKSAEALKDAVVTITCCPSGLHLGPRGSVWDLSRYGREAVSPVRTYTQAERKNQLQKEDRYLIFRDTTLPGAGSVKNVKKDCGPGVLVLDVGKTMRTELSLGIYCKVVLTLGPEFRDLTLGFWQKREAVTNDTVAKLVKDHPEQFAK